MSRLLDALKQLQQDAASSYRDESPQEERPHSPSTTATEIGPSEPSATDAERLHRLTAETQEHLETIRQFQALRESLDRAEAQNNAQAERLAKLEAILSNQSASHSDQLDSIQEEIRRRELSHRDFQSALRQEFEKLHAELTQRPPESEQRPDTAASPPLPPDLVDMLRELVRAGNAPPQEKIVPTVVVPPIAATIQEAPLPENPSSLELPLNEAETAALADLEQPAHRHTFGELASRIKDDLAEHDPEAAGAILLSGIGQPQIIAQAALRLALLWQQRGEEVLLIDGNCREKSLSHLLRIERRPGLLELSQRQLDWPETLLRLHQVPVHVIPAGSGNRTLTASSAQRRRMAELVENLSRWWSIILIVAEDYDAESTSLYGSVVSAGYLEVGLGRTTDEQLTAAARAYELHVMGHLGIIVSNAPID